jgi:hypothetical protein
LNLFPFLFYSIQLYLPHPGTSCIVLHHQLYILHTYYSPCSPRSFG